MTEIERVTPRGSVLAYGLTGRIAYKTWPQPICLIYREIAASIGLLDLMRP